MTVRQMRKLEEKVAIITGAGRGMGRAVALKLASEGARVAVNDYDEAPAAAVAREIIDAGGRAIACSGDVTTRDFGERFVGAALQAFAGGVYLFCIPGSDYISGEIVIVGGGVSI